MCGRATLTVDVDEIAEVIGALPLEGGLAKARTRKGWNLAPTDPMVIVRPNEHHERAMAVARWGLIPWWAKKDEAKKLGHKLVQARVETVAKTPAYRDAFKKHRCLVIVDGFYEWKTLDDGTRAPHWVHREDRKPFAIAGVWDSWKAPDTGEIIESCAVVTTEAKGHIADIHDRMPLVIPKKAFDAWLEGTPGEASKVKAITTELVATPVSTHVNNVRNDDEQCIAPLTSK